jgi:formate/nitrite transporter FocA (FNT family)
MLLEGSKTQEAVSRPPDLESAGDTDLDMKLSLWRGVVGGAIIGLLIGIGVVLYTDSPALNAWWGMPVIPIGQAFGWALFGMIAGGGGLFAKRRADAPAQQVDDGRPSDSTAA